MEKEFNTDNMNGFNQNSYTNYIPGFDTGDIYKDPMFNPIAQYEQAYTYYKYLCMQMDYKIKCKEYEKLCQNSEHRQ